MNRVDVVAASPPALAVSIDAPGATSVDLSPDGATLWVGTALEQIFAVDTKSLQVRMRYPIAGLTPIPGVVLNRPTELVALPNGELLVRLRQPAVAQSPLALWDPASNSFTNLTSSAPAVFQKGLGVMARSGDYSNLFVAANDATAEAALFNASGSVVAGPLAPGSAAILSVALNSDGGRIAVLLGTGGDSQVLLLNGTLNQIASYSPSNAAGLVFSPDGQTVYVAEALGNGRVITALSVKDMQKSGQVPDLAIAGVPTLIEAVDAAQTLCGLSNGGVTLLDVSQFVPLVPPAPSFAAAPVAVTFKDINTLTLTTPALTSGSQQLALTNPDGESVSLDAAFVAQ